MAIQLKKNEKLNLKKVDAGLNKVRLELKWQSPVKFDADAIALVCDANSKLLGEEYIVFYNQKSDPEGAVITKGDQRNGGGEGEVLTVDLTKVTSLAREIPFIITIDEAIKNGLNFGKLTGGSMTLVNDETGAELASFSFGTGEFTNETMIHMGSLFLGDNGWEIEAFGKGRPAMEIGDVLAHFGYVG